MLIKKKNSKKMPRKITIDGDLDIEKYRQLQDGAEVDTNDESARYLIEKGFAEVVDEIHVSAMSAKNEESKEE